MLSFGYAWTDNPEGVPNYYVAWDPESGDLTAVNLDTFDFEDVARIHDPNDVLSLMDGWTEHIYDPCSLEWIRRRCEARADELAGISKGGDS